MCNFFSCIVTKNETVLYDPMSDSHENIIDQNKDKYDLVDDTQDPAKLRFARVEITPPNGDVFAPVKDWNFNIDQSTTPTWWCDAYEKKAMKTLRSFLSKTLHVGKEIEKLSNGRYWVKDCRIANITDGICIVKLHNSTLESMHGGTLESMYGGTLEYMHGGTLESMHGGTLESMHGGALEYMHGGTLESMYGGTLEYMCGGTLKSMCGGALKSMRGGTLKSMHGGTLKSMCGGALKSMRGGALESMRGGTLESMHGGTLEYMCGGTLEYMHGGTLKSMRGNAIAILRTGNNPKIIVANDKITLETFKGVINV